MGKEAKEQIMHAVNKILSRMINVISITHNVNFVRECAEDALIDRAARMKCIIKKTIR